jgi:hypothetical protein
VEWLKVWAMSSNPSAAKKKKEKEVKTVCQQDIYTPMLITVPFPVAIN